MATTVCGSDGRFPLDGMDPGPDMTAGTVGHHTHGGAMAGGASVGDLGCSV